MSFPCRTATILITTKDRAQLFATSLRSALEQDFTCQIVVVDDGSSDNTSQVAREICPEVVLVRNEVAGGIIAARNQGFKHATGDVVLTLDDDATFSSRELVSSVMSEFDKPYIGVVELPLIDHLPGKEPQQRLPIEERSDDFLCVPIFSGGANAMRRDVFAAIGGYGGLFRQGEERGMALRMLADGLIVRLASRHHIDHYPQPRVGDRSDIIYWTARNFYQFGWSYVPTPQLPFFVAKTTLQQIKNGLRHRRPGLVASAMAAAVRDAWRIGEQRQPVSSAAFRTFRDMCNAKKLRFSQLSAIFDKYGLRFADGSA